MNDQVEYIKEAVKSYVLEKTFTDKDKISDDTLIFKEGYFDSMGFIFLITFLEEKFNIATQDRDLVEENFESINAISKYILRKSPILNEKCVG
jgi:acyl carrier protein